MQNLKNQFQKRFLFRFPALHWFTFIILQKHLTYFHMSAKFERAGTAVGQTKDFGNELVTKPTDKVGRDD